MQKVEGSSPFIRLRESPGDRGVFWFLGAGGWPAVGAGITRGYQMATLMHTGEGVACS